MKSILLATGSFLLENKDAIASSIIASASYETIKTAMSFSGLKKRITKFFISDEQIENYLKEICEKEAINPHKPERDIEDSYENLTGKDYNNELFNEIKTWIKENEKSISKTNMNFKNESGFNIGTQNAGKNIINISGDYKPKKA
ncbi:MAG: hypothetical protein WBG43_03025 [Marinifilaceae bacterium]